MPYQDQLTNLEEPSVLTNGRKTTFYDELFLEWIYTNEPKFYFNKDHVLCFFTREGKSYGTRVNYAYVQHDVAKAIKLCIRNVTSFEHCFEQAAKS
jgi:hypothetical protein